LSDRRKDTTQAHHHAKPDTKGSAADGSAGDPVDGALSSVWDDARVVRLMADDGFRQALGRIYRLARDDQKAAGGSEEEALLLYASVAVTYTRPTAKRGKQTDCTPKENWERCWTQDTGKTWKALTEFPDRIRRMAEEVEHVGRSYVFDPKRITSEIPLAMYAKREFPILPTTLRNYAGWLEAQVASTSAYIKSFYRRTLRGALSHFTLDVSKQVKLITGQFHDREVADLLNVADLVLNPDTAKSGLRFNEQNIALLRSRQKRKTPKT
jgi:hypothetical protein